MNVPQLRREVLRIDSIINYMQLFFRYVKNAANIIGDHARNTNYRLQPWIGEHLRFGTKHVPMPRAKPSGESRQWTPGSIPSLQPSGMHAIAGTKNVTARNSFVALHQREIFSGEGSPYASSKPPIAPQSADVEWVA